VIRTAALAVAAALAAPTLAQSATPDVTPEQISSGGRSVAAPAPADNGPPVAADQISTGSATVAAPGEASTPRQGRVGLTARAIGGRDRCVDDARRTADCENTVERRSAEFAQPQPPPLTAEQRLLIQLQTGEDAEHRLQRGQPGQPGQSQAADALAGALAQPPPAEPPPGPVVDPAVLDAVGAAMGITVNVIPPSSR
jgi:hypothetical protein